MATLRNVQTGETIDLEGHDAIAAVQSGQYAPVGDARVGVQGATGPATMDIAGAIEANRYRPVNLEDPASAEYARRGALQQQRFDEQYGGAGGKVRAFGEGAVDAVTLGGYGVVNDALGGDAENYAKANPKTHLAGELGGLIASTVLTSGAAGSTKLGMLLAKTPAGAISKATAAMGESIGGFKGLAAAQMLEGAAYATGQTASQLLITDEPLSAEAVWSELGKNAAFGAGAGLAGAAVVSTLGKGWTKLRAAHAASAPIADIASVEGRAAVTSMADAAAEMDTLASGLARSVEATTPPAAAVKAVTAPEAVAAPTAAAPEPVAAPAPAPTTAPIDDFATANAPALRDAGFDVAAPAAASPAAAAAPASAGPASFDDLENLYNRMLKEHVAGVSEAKVDDMARLGVQNAAEFKALKSDVNRMRSTFRHARDAVKAGSPKAAERTANLRKSIDSLGSRLGVDIEGELATVRGGAAAPTPAAADAGYRPVESTRADIRVDTDTFAVPEGTTQGQRDALSLYHGTAGYTDINKALRQQALTGEAIPAGEPHRIYKTTTHEQIAALDDLIAKSSTKRPTTVYRGLGELPHDLTPGAVIPEPAFMSASTRETIAQHHARKAMLKLDVPAGSPALYVPNVSKSAGEAEVLLPRGTKYRIKSVESGEDYQLVHAEILPPDGASQGAASVSQRMDDAFGRLDTAGDNYVFIGDLRKALPDVPRPEFDAALNDLRKAKHFTVDSLQNQHVDPSAKYGADWKEQLMPQGQSAPVGLVARRGGPLAETAAAKAAKPAPRVGPKPDLDEFGGEMQRLKPRPADGFAMPAELSGPETRAIRWYGDNNYSPYKGIHSAEDLNALLRSGDDAHPAVRELTAHLDSVLAKSATTKPTTVYRGIVADPAEYTAGAVLDQPAYLSASTDVAKADEFIAEAGRRGGSKIRLSIDVPAGTPAVNMPSVMPDLSKRGFDEAEVLLGRGQKLRVLSSEAGPDGVINVRAAVGDAVPEVAAGPTAASTVAPAVTAPAEAAVAAPGAELRAAQRTARSALGLGADGTITRDVMTRMLTEPAESLAPKLRALDEYFSAAQKFARETGNDAALEQISAATSAMGQATKAATAGADSSKLGEIAVGLGLYEAGDTVGGPVGDIAKVAGAFKLAKGVGGKAAARAGKGFLGKVLRGSARLAGGKGARHFLPGGGLVSYELGANAFQSMFNTLTGQRAIAGVTQNAVTRIGAAMSTAGRTASTAVGRGQLAAGQIIRDARFGTGEQTAAAPKRTTTAAAFADRSKELAAIAANPMAHQMSVHEQVAEIRKVAPYVADELEQLAVAVPAFLYDKMPRDPGTMMRMGESTWRAPDYDIRVWGEYVRGALTPIDAFESAVGGHKSITPQAAESIRTLFPSLYGKMQQELAVRAPELRKTLTLQDRTRLSILFDTPLDSTMRPDFRGFIAEQHATRAQQSAQQAASAKPGAPSANPAPMTGAQLLLH